MISFFKQNFLKILIIILSVFVFSWAFYSLFKISKSVAPDFSVLWKASVDLISRKSFYKDTALEFIYLLPPISTLFYLPFVVFDERTAQILFSVISFFSLLGCIFISLKLVFNKVNVYTFFLGCSLALLAFPTKFTLGMGQVNIISLLLLLMSFFYYKNKKDLLSGILLATSIISKPTFAIFWLFFFFKKSWKVVFYSTIALFIAFLISITLSGGINEYYYWFNNIFPSIAGLQGKEIYYNQGFFGFIVRLSTIFRVNQWLYNSFLVGLPILSLYLIQKSKDENISFSLLIITLLLIDPLSWQHHFVWLILPFMVAARYVIKIKKCWAWSIFGVAYLLISWNFENFFSFTSFPVSLILSNIFYGAVLLYLLLLYSVARYKKL